MPVAVLLTLTLDLCLFLEYEELALKQKNPRLELECVIEFIVDFTVSESKPLNSNSTLRASKKPVVNSGSM